MSREQETTGKLRKIFNMKNTNNKQKKTTPDIEQRHENFKKIY